MGVHLPAFSLVVFGAQAGRASSPAVARFVAESGAWPTAANTTFGRMIPFRPRALWCLPWSGGRTGPGGLLATRCFVRQRQPPLVGCGGLIIDDRAVVTLGDFSRLPQHDMAAIFGGLGYCWAPVQGCYGSSMGRFPWLRVTLLAVHPGVNAPLASRILYKKVSSFLRRGKPDRFLDREGTAVAAPLFVSNGYCWP